MKVWRCIDRVVGTHWFQSFNDNTRFSLEALISGRFSRRLPFSSAAFFALQFARFRNSCCRWTIAGARKTIILYGRTGSWVGPGSLSRCTYLPRVIAKSPKCHSATGVNELSRASLVRFSRSSTHFASSGHEKYWGENRLGNHQRRVFIDPLFKTFGDNT